MKEDAVERVLVGSVTRNDWNSFRTPYGLADTGLRFLDEERVVSMQHLDQNELSL